MLTTHDRANHLQAAQRLAAELRQDLTVAKRRRNTQRARELESYLEVIAFAIDALKASTNEGAGILPVQVEMG